MPRDQRIQFDGRLYRDALVRLWTANPLLTLDEARRASGASRSIVAKVRRDLVARGLLKAGAQKR